MSTEKTKNSNLTMKSFPSNKNIRVTIEGLAICEFEKKTEKKSKIHFLQLDSKYGHELRFQIICRNRSTGRLHYVKRYTDNPRVIDNTISEIAISGDLQTLNNYRHSYRSGLEHSLTKLINLKSIHKKVFHLTSSSSKKKTTLRLFQTAFYVSALSSKKYTVRLNGRPHPHDDELGHTVGGYMNCESDGSFTVDIVGLYKKTFKVTQNSDEYEYEISFSNHCEMNIQDCVIAIGRNGQDIEFLYDWLTPPETPIKLIKKSSKGAVKSEKKLASILDTENVAACLPAQVNP